MAGIVDEDMAGERAARTALGIGLVSDEYSDADYEDRQLFTGRGYDITRTSNPIGGSCTLEPPAGVTRTMLERSIAPALNHWTEGPQLEGRRLWIRILPEGAGRSSKRLILSIGESETGRPFVVVASEAG